jgi:hypothetical protein
VDEKLVALLQPDGDNLDDFFRDDVEDPEDIDPQLSFRQFVGPELPPISGLPGRLMHQLGLDGSDHSPRVERTHRFEVIGRLRSQLDANHGLNGSSRRTIARG